MQLLIISKALVYKDILLRNFVNEMRRCNKKTANLTAVK